MSARLWNRLRREGLGGTARAVARRMRKVAYLREEHVWYQCDLKRSAVRRDLPEGLRLVRAEASQVDSVARLGQDLEEARERFEAGADVWLVVDGDEPVFLCFTFRQTAPVIAAADGMLVLPPGAACLEDAVTAPAVRGRGIASAAWAQVGERLGRAGFTTLVVKIETGNGASKRAAEKAGFLPVAVMRHQRTGARRHTAVRALGGGLGDELAARLS
jgi:GNAT superfamily N-acetyltransferase